MRPRSLTKRHGKPRMDESQPLEGGLSQHERLGRLERDDVRRPRQAVEEADFAEQVAGLECADALRRSVSQHEHLERTMRNDEEAAVDLTAADSPGLNATETSPAWTARQLAAARRRDEGRRR